MSEAPLLLLGPGKKEDHDEKMYAVSFAVVILVVFTILIAVVGVSLTQNKAYQKVPALPQKTANTNNSQNNIPPSNISVIPTDTDSLPKVTETETVTPTKTPTPTPISTPTPTPTPLPTSTPTPTPPPTPTQTNTPTSTP